MTSRNPSEPFDEIAHQGGAAAARMVEDTAALPSVPVTAGETAAENLVRHTHAADRVVITPSTTRPRSGEVAQGVGQWIGDVSRRFESVRRYVRNNDAKQMQADAMAIARRYPMQALAGTVLAGLVVGRLLRRR